MTREEAIKAIKSHCYFANLVPVGKEALDMAIKALEQEPCEDFVVGVDFTGRFVKASEAFREPCDDAISRQAVIEHYNSGEILQCNHVSRNNLLNYIEGLPSIQPKSKTGHWVSKHIVDDCNGVVTWYECSECGRSVDAPITEEFMLKDYPYCHCGAKMLPTDSEKE